MICQSGVYLFPLCLVSLLLVEFWYFPYPNYVYSVVSTITALFIDWYNISSFIINYPSYINYSRNELFAKKTRDAKVNSDLELCWAMLNFLLLRAAGLSKKPLWESAPKIDWRCFFDFFNEPKSMDGNSVAGLYFMASIWWFRIVDESVGIFFDEASYTF